MKKLELKQMESLDGGKGGFGTSFACGTYLIALGALTVASGGAAALVTAPLAAIGCGIAVGHGLETNSWW